MKIISVKQFNKEADIRYRNKVRKDNKTMNHTATPWTYDGEEIKSGKNKVLSLESDGGCGDPECCGEASYHIELSQANAQFIVQCVNSHDELVEAINNIEKLSIGIDTNKLSIQQRNTITLIYQNVINAKQALKKAGA